MSTPRPTHWMGVIRGPWRLGSILRDAGARAHAGWMLWRRASQVRGCAILRYSFYVEPKTNWCRRRVGLRRRRDFASVRPPSGSRGGLRGGRDERWPAPGRALPGPGRRARGPHHPGVRSAQPARSRPAVSEPAHGPVADGGQAAPARAQGHRRRRRPPLCRWLDLRPDRGHRASARSGRAIASPIQAASPPRRCWRSRRWSVADWSSRRASSSTRRAASAAPAAAAAPRSATPRSTKTSPPTTCSSTRTRPRCARPWRTWPAAPRRRWSSRRTWCR